MKKWILGLAGLALAATLAGCSSGNDTVANMKGAKITKDEFYNEMKDTSTGQSTLRDMIVLKALQQQYGKKVSDKKVDSQYNAVKKQYGAQFSSALAQSGLTTKSFKNQVKMSLLTDAALKDLKKPSEKQLTAQWASYTPKITVQHILVAKKSTADEVEKALAKDNSEKNFDSLAKKYSTDTGTKNKGGKLAAFDNTDTSLDATFRAAALKLTKSGDYTKTPVKSTYGYHVIRAIKVPAKGQMSDHKKELTKQLYTKWESDQTIMTGIVKKVLTKANVTIKDNDLKNVLSVYMDPSSAAQQQQQQPAGGQ